MGGLHDAGIRWGRSADQSAEFYSFGRPTFTSIVTDTTYHHSLIIVDEIKKIVTESTNVKFPEKRQQLLELIDSMGPDDNPILAIYKLKD